MRRAATSASDTRARRLAALAAVAAASVLPPILAELDVAAAVEIVDHVVPGMIAVAAALYAMALTRRGAGESLPALAAVGVCAVAGIWETATHVGLVLDAGGPDRPVGAVLLHASPGLVLLLLSLWLLLTEDGAR